MNTQKIGKGCYMTRGRGGIRKKKKYRTLSVTEKKADGGKGQD